MCKCYTSQDKSRSLLGLLNHHNHNSSLIAYLELYRPLPGLNCKSRNKIQKLPIIKPPTSKQQANIIRLYLGWSENPGLQYPHHQKRQPVNRIVVWMEQSCVLGSYKAMCCFNYLIQKHLQTAHGINFTFPITSSYEQAI